MTRLSILIADDDPVILMILGHNLRLAGFDVHHTASGTQAVRMARHPRL